MDTKQKQALCVIDSGRNLFLTGAAGTGKSYTIQEIIVHARTQFRNIFVTALTGSAAVLIGGKTLHSALGIGLGTKRVEQLVAETKLYKKWLLRKLLKLDLLIVDEVSMLTAELLEKINDYLIEIRKNSQPFGGVQVVFVGDFFQLGPVDGEYCFVSSIWKKLNFQTIVLDVLYRQKGNDLFQSILMRARVGEITDEDITVIMDNNNDDWESSGVKPTKLFAKNAYVDAINSKRYNQLVENGASTYSYRTVYSCEKAKNWAQAVGIKEEVSLCVGAQVIITYNIDVDNDIVNGTRGVVVSFDSCGPILCLRNGTRYTVLPQSLASEDDASVYVTTMPIRLAFALSIHKSQGCTLDAVEMDLGPSIFTEGQAYTALSRAKSLDGLRVTNIHAKSFKVHSDVLRFYENVKPL